MKYVVWLLTLPARLFDVVAGRFVEPPVDLEPTREELKEQRDVLLEELEKPQAGGMGGSGA